MAEPISDDALFDPIAREMAQRRQDMRAQTDWELATALRALKRPIPKEMNDAPIKLP